MATKYIVDTHDLIWHLEGTKLLGASAKSVIEPSGCIRRNINDKETGYREQ